MLWSSCAFTLYSNDMRTHVWNKNVFVIIRYVAFVCTLILCQYMTSTMTVSITFESDCSTETYTEAKEREHSRKHEQATCVPITLIDGAMINLIKTQMENTLKK